MNSTETGGRNLSLAQSQLRLRCTPGYGYPPLPTPFGASVQVLADQLLENEWRSPEEIKRRQFEQLKALLRFAKEQCPFYTERMNSCGLDPEAMSSFEDFERMPLLARTDLQQNLDTILSKKQPQGTQVAGELSTSGSTGSPVHLRGTNLSSLMWNACNARDHVWSGIDITKVLVSIRHFGEEVQGACSDDGLQLPNWGGQTAQIFASGTSRLMDIGQSVAAQLAFLLKHDPDYLLSYPSNLDTLGRMLAERGEKLTRLKLIQSIGEVLQPDVRERIEQAFGAPVWDLYSCVEVGYVASQCSEGHGYHVHEENVLVEILDEEDKPCAPGESGRVVLTPLVNYATPLIRYDVGDYATLMSGPCPCGRGLLGLTEVIGRQRGQVLMPDGSVRFSSKLSTALRDAGQIEQFKVIQHKRDKFEILIVPMEGFGEEQEAKIAEAFQSYLGVPVEVEFTTVREIERTLRGKYLDFVCLAK